MIKLSKAGKMPCKSFSLQAITTCPGMYIAGTKQVKDVCKGCYATKGMYRFPVVKAARDSNLDATKDDRFVPEMVAMIEKEKSEYFRWFDSGDIYSAEFLEKVYQVCFDTPNVKHWIPTKSRELFNQVTWAALEQLPNVTVRYSSPSIDGDYTPDHGSTVVKAADHFPANGEVYTCPSSTQDGKCADCRACWNKGVKVVAYVYH
jgi:hypothetical protein